MTSRPTLLVVGGGEATEEYIKLLSQSYNFILIDKNENCAAKSLCQKFIRCSIYDPESIIKYLLDNEYQDQIDGVICLGTDAPVTVAKIAATLNLTSVPVDSAILTSNKILMKKVFQKLNIFTPKYKSVNELDQVTDFIEKNNYPVIIKPDDSSGARGVFLLWNNENIEDKFLKAKNLSKTETVIVEEYIDGHQVSSESIIYNSKSYNFGFSDRNYEYISKATSSVIENGGDLPVSISTKTQIDIGACIQKLAKELKIESGVIKGDIIITKNKIYFIEIALRLSGGYFCSHKIPHNTGVNILEIATKIATNQKVKENELIVKFNRPVSQRFFIPEGGTIVDYNANFNVNNNNIIFSNIKIQKGKLTHFPEDHTERLGCVIASGINKNDAIKNAETYIKNLQVKYI